MQDSDTDLVDKIAAADCESAPISSAERALLVFAEKLTRAPATVIAADLEALRTNGWKEPQIAEAVYIIAMFNFFDRVADAFGLQDPQYREHGVGTKE